VKTKSKMASKHHKNDPGLLTNSLFGGTGTLTDSLFRNNGGTKKAKIENRDGGIFSRSTEESFSKVRKDRIQENRMKSKKRLKVDNHQSAANNLEDEEESIHEVLKKRKRQSECSLVKAITFQPIYPTNDKTSEKRKKGTISTLPVDVQIQETVEVIRTNGFGVIQNAVPKSLLSDISRRCDEIQQKVLNALQKQGMEWIGNNAKSFSFYEAASRCAGRMDLRYETSKPPFSDMSIVQNESLLPIIHSLLGGDFTNEESQMPNLVYAGLILSSPGSKDQPWHQDGIPLFPEAQIMDELPPYAINVFLPLSDEDGSLEAGPTELIPESHRLAEDQVMNLLENTSKNSKAVTQNDQTSSDDDVSETQDNIVNPILRQGDALIYDYRVCHRGTSNLTHRASKSRKGKTRRILYLMYARPWFKEHLNFGTQKLFSDR